VELKGPELAEGRSLPESGLLEDQLTGDEPATNELRENELRENELVARSFELEDGVGSARIEGEMAITGRRASGRSAARAGGGQSREVISGK